MKPPHHITSHTVFPTMMDVVQWQSRLLAWHARLAPLFSRSEPYHRALRCVQALLSTAERKNGWQLAEQAREATPYGMQRLLSQSTWDQNGMRDQIRAFALEHLGTEQAVIAIDETSFVKRGSHSAGVKVQYCGSTGRVENCQVGVFLSYVTARGHTLIDRELYFPKEWVEDAARARSVGIPEQSSFQTKPELAICMLSRLQQAHLSIGWVVADSVYGGHAQLRDWLETHQYRYVGAVASDEPVVLALPHGVRRLEVGDIPAVLEASTHWQRVALSQGTKGPRLFDWTLLPIWHHGQADGKHCLLIRRSLAPKTEYAFFLVFAPPDTPLQTIVTALGSRWRIEEDFEQAKALGLDQYEVRSLVGWYRHITLVLLALAFLASLTAPSPPEPPPTDPLASLPAASPPVGTLCPLSVPEVHHLLAHLLFLPPSSVHLVFAWSAWRRCHQQLASWFHTRRRLTAQATSSRSSGSGRP